MATINERLHEAMRLRGMRATDLSKQSGLSRGAISQYLSGKVNPKQDKIFILAHALRVSPSYLMGVEDAAPFSITSVKLTDAIRTAIHNDAPVLKDEDLPKLELSVPKIEPIPAEEIEQMKRNAIARAFLDIMLQGSPEAQAIIARATVTADGDITLPGLDAGGQKYINKMRAAFIEAVQDATKEGSINKVTLKIEPPQK